MTLPSLQINTLQIFPTTLLIFDTSTNLDLVTTIQRSSTIHRSSRVVRGLLDTSESRSADTSRLRSTYQRKPRCASTPSCSSDAAVSLLSITSVLVISIILISSKSVLFADVSTLHHFASSLPMFLYSQMFPRFFTLLCFRPCLIFAGVSTFSLLYFFFAHVLIHVFADVFTFLYSVLVIH